MKSRIAKRSIVISGHKTSLSVEDDFWSCLKVIAGEHDITLSQLVGSIDSQRRSGNLSSAVRLFVLDHYQRAAEHERPAPFVSAIDEGAKVLREN